VLALLAHPQSGIEQRGTDPTPPCVRIDHAGQLDGGRAVCVNAQEAKESLAVPPQDVLDRLPTAIA
jgi:hypothetical protein